MKRESSWTDERLADLVKMWNAGDSALEVATALGITRNAVLGKVHRLGLVKHSNTPVLAPRPRRPSLEIRAARILARPAKPATAPPPAPIAVELEITPRNLPLLALTEHVCRWPIGNPRTEGFCFCGGDCTAGVYCAGHTRLAYTASRTR